MAVSVDAWGVDLAADLGVPDEPAGVVVFAHGSGSSRHSGRNRSVAESLRRDGFATLLMDLLTEREEREDRVTGHLRFDIELLAERVAASVEWTSRYPATRGLPIGLFGASTGAAAALVAAAGTYLVKAVVSRGGRPDLAGSALARVRAPTLLIVGGRDEQVLELNRAAAERLATVHRIEVVEGATHLFEEPGALDEVARLAGAWFREHL
ncbi:dienelactone hydrolase family protein [Saccharothrix deserti]|uniref:dienelactone hydrolase family protein n=1 Tax=Saccharothrix deserti TaxID=2593674 RepID=UPI00192E55EA|nr:dienelactone hydrolase family protein [Saccharothrix deserti]